MQNNGRNSEQNIRPHFEQIDTMELINLVATEKMYAVKLETLINN